MTNQQKTDYILKLEQKKKKKKSSLKKYKLYKIYSKTKFSPNYDHSWLTTYMFYVIFYTMTFSSCFNTVMDTHIWNDIVAQNVCSEISFNTAFKYTQDILEKTQHNKQWVIYEMAS